MKSFITSRLSGGKEDVPPQVRESAVVDPEATLPENLQEKTPTHDGQEVDSNSDEDTPSKDALEGVKKVEAVAMVWSKKELYVAYACIFLVFFVNSLQQQITGNLSSYVLSDFASHSLVPVAGIVSSILGGVLKLPTAQIMNIWGRAEGLIVMTTCCTIGLILMAVCQNVETYAAAQCFYWVGYNGMTFVLDVFICDTSNLRNRALAFAFASAPYIATTWAGPAAAQAFYLHSTWRWAFGCFTIITPVMTLPILYLLYSNQRKAAKLGVLVKEPSGRTLTQSIWKGLIDFDVVGIILVCAGFVLFLLPFSLAGYQTDKWASASIIVMLVLGVFFLAVFAVWERFFAPRCFIPFRLLANRTIASACVLAAVVFVAFYLWDGYYYSYLQVVHGTSIQNTGYIYNIYSIGSCFWSFAVSIAIKYSGRFKWLALYFGAPLMILGVGLMIHFRQPDANIGYVIMCQIFIAFAGGTLVICQEIAALASARHEDAAAILAVLGLSSSVGGAIGSSMSGAIWTNTLPGALADRLPAGIDVDTIVNSLVVQLSYPMGDPVRTAIIAAYGVAQKRMTIAATSVLVLSFVCIALWKDIRINDVKNVKGRVL